MATNVHLTSELEQFARHCVESGRYNNVSEVVRSALRLLQDAETRRERFMSMVDDAEAEGERSGFLDIDDVAAAMNAAIEGEGTGREGTGRGGRDHS